MDNKIFSKVFLWLFLGLLVTFVTGYAVSLNTNMIYNIFDKFFMFIILAEFGLVIFLNVRINKMALTTAIATYLLYSLMTGLTFAVIFLVYEMSSIMMVFGLTSLLMLIMGIIGFVTDIDLTKISNILFISLLFIIVFGIINIFLGSVILNFWLLVLGIILFTAFICYDIQRIKNHMFNIEDENKMAIIGAFHLYLDFINLFIRLLSLFGKRKD